MTTETHQAPIEATGHIDDAVTVRGVDDETLVAALVTGGRVVIAVLILRFDYPPPPSRLFGVFLLCRRANEVMVRR